MTSSSSCKRQEACQGDPSVPCRRDRPTGCRPREVREKKLSQLALESEKRHLAAQDQVVPETAFRARFAPADERWRGRSACLAAPLLDAIHLEVGEQ